MTNDPTQSISTSDSAWRNGYRGTSADAIRFHYDASNEFYRLWLDPYLCYSCAMWSPQDGDADLERAQIRKLDFHAEAARAPGTRRVLDVGCGWGSQGKRLVEEHDVGAVVGLTISKEQAATSCHERVEIRLQNWFDHDAPSEYDAIISAGAFEHFVAPGLTHPERVAATRVFFERCHGWLVAGGWISLQTCVQLNMRPDNIHETLTGTLPDSTLPRLTEIAEGCERLFEVVALRDDRIDYVRTCRAWLRRLQAKRAEASEIVGADVVARYERWLRFCMASFHSGTLGLLRLSLRRIDRPRA